MTDSENTKDQLIRGREDGRMLAQYLDAVLMHLPVGIAILEGEDFRYFRINQALADINGLSVEEHLGKTVAEIIPDPAKILSNLRKVRDQGQASPERYFTIRLPSNPDRDVHLMDFHFPIVVDGVVKAIGAVVLDVTAQKQSEDELKKAYAELELREAEAQAGLELIRHLLARKPDLATLEVPRHDESLYAERAIRVGARRYVSKLEVDEEIVQAVRQVLRGGTYLKDMLKDEILFGAAASTKPQMQSPLEVLSAREFEVFEMTGRGRSTREIAERMHISVKTVESYRARIKTKLNLESGAELMQHAVRWVVRESTG